MVAVILPHGYNNSSFNALDYSLKKEKMDKGWLVEMKNFPGFLDKSNVMEVRNFLSQQSELAQIPSKKLIKNPQFHAVISTENKKHSSEDLKDVANEWMDKMGYSKQPYVVVFHGDSVNNHVHIVSTRVDLETGKKINNDNERYRSLEAINHIMGYGQRKTANISKGVLNYDFETAGQLTAVLDQYKIPFEKNDNGISVKWGEEVFNYDDAYFTEIRKKEKDVKRQKQIKAILYKYIKEKDLNVFRIKHHNKIEFHSALKAELAKNLGLEIVFHNKDDKDPFGYSLIDHKENKVYKGSELMKMKYIANFTNNEIDKKFFDILEKTKAQNLNVKHYYLKNNNIEFLRDFLEVPQKLNHKDYLKSWKNYENLDRFLNDYNLEVLKDQDKIYLHDKYSNQIFDTSFDYRFRNFDYFVNNQKQKPPEIVYDNTRVASLNVNQISNLIKDFSYALNNSSSEDQQNKRKRKRTQKRKR